MSSKGAIKKTTTEPKSQSSLKVKVKTSSQGDVEEKTEKKKEFLRADLVHKSSLKSQSVQKTKTLSRTSSRADEDKTDRSHRRKEPQIIESRALAVKKTKTESSLTRRNILPDRNLLKSKQNDFSSSSSIEKSTAASVAKRQTLAKTKSESSASNKTNTILHKSHREKIKPSYNEVRGSSSIYAPKDAASKLRSMSKSLEAKRVEDKSKRSEKPLSRRISKERKNSRTLSPSEIKVLKPPVDKTNKSLSNEDDKDDSSAKTESDIDEDTPHQYDDDFEDYESDFDDNVSAEISEESENTHSSLELEPVELRTEERKKLVISADIRKRTEERRLDSGHYDLAEARKRATMVDSLMPNRMKTPPPLPEARELSSQSYSREEKYSEIKSLPSSTDEGFEDLRSGDFVRSPSISQTQINPKILKEKPKKMRRKKLTRGQILMNMIKLDTVEWSLYESTPISYDEFIRTYGKLNTQQTYTQTNEDNLDVEIQTDSYEFENKWTQFPVQCRNKLETIEDVKQFKIEHLGVGGDSVDNVSLANPTYDVLKLNEFLNRAGKVMLALLEEKEFGGNIVQNETHEFPFSDGFIKLSISSLSFLCGREVTMLHYSEVNNKILMSIHAAVKQKTESDSKQDYVMDCCIGCVWNVNEPSRPIKLFYSQSPITACCFHCTNSSIIFAGLEDGSVCLWDLREEETWHQKIIDKIHEDDWVVRSATYTTAANWEIEAHKCPVIAIRVVSKMDQDDTESLNDKFISIQICSLDEGGHLILWSVMRNISSNIDDLGLTQWAKVRLVKSQNVPLFKKNESNHAKKQFIDMSVDNFDSNNLYLATDSTDILYANCIGTKNNTSHYNINDMDSCGITTCLEVCPFKQSYFFAGCNDGSIRLHSLNVETPILKIKDEYSSAGIKSIQWSKSKPLTIYVLDDHSRIAVWDLSISDIHPSHTVSTKTWGHVKCMRLSPCNTNRDMLNQYLALGTDTGNVEVHKLKKNFYISQQDEFAQEMDIFLRYVSIL